MSDKRKKAIKIAKEAAKERRIICPYCKEPCCTIEVSDILYRKIVYECKECLNFVCDCCGRKFALDENLEIKNKHE